VCQNLFKITYQVVASEGSKEMGITGHEMGTREGNPNIPSVVA
jgi:hypothetical protein